MSIYRQQTAQLDTVIRIVTPENISFTYRLASLSRRAMAFFIDMVILGLIMLLIQILLMVLVAFFYFPQGLAFGIILVCAFALYWFFGAFFETFWNGQTLGKRLVGIRVVSTEGQPINSFQAIIRNIMRSADLQPVFSGGVAFFTMQRNRRFQRFGDLVCGTMVIVDESTYGRHELARFKHPEIFKVAEQIPPLALASDTLKALALYVHRRRAVSPRRREHIAAVLAVPLIERHALPENVSFDLLLCAVYHAHFVAMSDAEKEEADRDFEPAQLVGAIQV